MTQPIIKFRHGNEPPSHLLPLLTTDGSLTALLEQRAGKPIKVQIIKECFVPLTFAQKKLLDLPIHQPSLAKVREVLLYGNEKTAWVRAMSIFPLSYLKGNAKRLQYLKNTPIGYVLFKSQRKLPLNRSIYYDKHWTRSTVYDWHGRKFLIQEQFLS